MSRSHKGTPHRLLVVIYPGVNLLDVTGPIQAFEEANRLQDPPGNAYRVKVASVAGGAVISGAGLTLWSEALEACLPEDVDTLLLPGGSSNGIPPDQPAIADWVRRHAGQFGRICSVCTGAFILAESGLMEGCRVTTHWRWADELAARYPSLRVEADAIFLEQGNIWSTAGVTAGIDLALALIERDYGHRTAISCARDMVVYMKRPGGQSQYSAPLSAQYADQGLFADLHAWIASHLEDDLRIERLAEAACMSPRNFARLYAATMGTTPAKTVELMRLEAARLALETTGSSIKTVADQVGLRHEQNLRRLFQRHYGVNPAQYRHRFSLGG
ncbi:GlxA family transcriptional regulator [Biostraticola tofi]|uniref:Transcriptional regulator GlxA family with amidase domain n=1 Tax=Biostraticola tofi TaxID=466109 RepID=A0A4R3YYJ8_9GAMM|nr:GlxA family transcriptional regulator [Biostraticola tofi]TCV98305.1 transcriptional regulator GlxA family with amidase domain [Biostraticola tofi]